MIKSWWDKYWFRSVHPIYLEIVRIGIVGFQIYYLIADGMLGRLEFTATLPVEIYDPLPVVNAMLLPLGWHFRLPVEVLQGLYALTLAAGCLGLIGLFSRFSLLLFALGNMLAYGIIFSYGDIHHAAALMTIALLILAVSPAGSRYSVDDLIRRWQHAKRRRSEVRPYTGVLENRQVYWPLLLMQWMLALIYLSAAQKKILTGGFDWLNGYTLQYYFINNFNVWGREAGLWLGTQHELAIAFGWASILFEMTFFLVLFVPRLAWLYMPAGIIMHAAIFLIMGPDFSQYFPVYLAFLPCLGVFKPVKHNRIERKENFSQSGTGVLRGLQQRSRQKELAGICRA